MKPKFLLSIFLMSALTINILSADPTEKELLKLSFKSEGIVNLTYTALSKGSAKVNILDSKGILVFSDRIENNYGVMRLYDISSLPEGEYHFEVIEKNSKISKSIVYTKKVINTNKNLEVNVAQTENLGKFNLICKGVANSPVYVTIYSKKQGLIYEDYIESEKDFSRIYDLSKINDDSFVFEVKSEDKVSSKEIDLSSKEFSLSK